MAQQTFRACRLALAATVALALAWSGSTGAAAGKKSDAVVKAAATASKADDAGKQTVTLTLTMDKGWHIYANPVDNESFAGNKTVVTVTGKNKLEDVKVEYPAGKLVKDKDVGDYKVYEDKIEIKAVVRRAKGDSDPLEVSVKFMACDAKSCLLPATVKVPVK
jgi:uncharacterized protein